MNDKFWMTRALLFANKALFLNELPIGSVLVYKNIELGNGINCCYLSTFNHSEIKLFNKANFYFSNICFINTTLYITLEPCSTCISLIYSYKIRRIVFATYSLNLNNHINNLYLTGGIMENESSFLLKKFFAKKRLF